MATRFVRGAGEQKVFSIAAVGRPWPAPSSSAASGVGGVGLRLRVALSQASRGGLGQGRRETS